MDRWEYLRITFEWNSKFLETTTKEGFEWVRDNYPDLAFMRANYIEFTYKIYGGERSDPQLFKVFGNAYLDHLGDLGWEAYTSGTDGMPGRTIYSFKRKKE